MSLRYEHLVDQRITDQELLPESIPHLLHHDLGYLWFLSMRPDLRPRRWADRLQAWKDLTTLFLLGALDLEPVDVAGLPLGQLLADGGIESLFWVKTRPTANGASPGRVVGVTSTTVLVRPLPDCTRELAAFLAERVAADRRPDELRHFAALAVGKLRELDTDPSRRLASILEKEFLPGGHVPGGAQRAGHNVNLRLLRRIAWSGASEFDDVVVFVRGDREAAWAPRCSSCNAFLTRLPNSDAVEVPAGASVVGLTCRCGTTTDVDLRDFLIWQRTGSEVIVWETAEPLSGRRPPRPTLSNIDLTYRWVAAELAGETARTELTLRFPGRTFRSAHVEDCFYKTLLVLGQRGDFSGLPIKPEWLDAVEGLPGEPTITHNERTSEYVFRIHGIPVPLRRSYGAGALEEHANAGVGVFPDPRVVGNGWKLFRSFVVGLPNARIAGTDWSQQLPDLAEARTGCPRTVSVEVEIAGRRAGASFLCPRPERTATGLAKIAVDFGTSNTVVYAQVPDGGRVRNEAIKPEAACDAAAWFGARPETSHRAGRLFPCKSPDSRDPAAIPSALWRGPDLSLIRWDADRPGRGFEPLTGFKWDQRESGRDFSEERRRYVQEVLTLTLPIVAARLGPIAEVDLGLTFPLAFDDEQKRRFITLTKEIQQDAREFFGIRVAGLYSINESAAAIAAFGVHREGETFLIADMGGGTLDLALVTTVDDGRGRPTQQVDQIGSLRVGGEEFIRALARSSGTGDEWLVRDRIANGDADTTFGSDSRVGRMLERFTAIAFEYLRTMIAAHRDGSGADAEIKILLVGNGWHLVDALSSDRRERGARRVWHDYYANLIANLGLERVALYRPELDVPTKHLAALGAMNNMLTGQERELEAESQLVRLPAGRTFRFGSVVVPWSRLIGSAERLGEVPAGEFRGGNLVIEKEGPPAAKPWTLHLSRVFANQVPEMSEARLRQRLVEGLRDGSREMTVGPLQVIVEESWLPTLGDVR